MAASTEDAGEHTDEERCDSRPRYRRAPLTPRVASSRVPFRRIGTAPDRAPGPGELAARSGATEGPPEAQPPLCITWMDEVAGAQRMSLVEAEGSTRAGTAWAAATSRAGAPLKPLPAAGRMAGVTTSVGSVQVAARTAWTGHGNCLVARADGRSRPARRCRPGRPGLARVGPARVPRPPCGDQSGDGRCVPHWGRSHSHYGC
jgi:hypothetical protein